MFCLPTPEQNMPPTPEQNMHGEKSVFFRKFLDLIVSSFGDRPSLAGFACATVATSRG